MLAFNDLWWPDLWPDQKSDRSDFFLIFDALSNAAFAVSLRGPGAELEGGVQTPPPAGRGNPGPPAGRGLARRPQDLRATRQTMGVGDLFPL